jgi:hypothetical protein
MRRKTRTRKRKPKPAELEAAWNRMDKAYSRFKKTETAVLRLFYDAGNKRWVSFREAVKEAAIEMHSAGKWIGFSNRTIEESFRAFDV